MSKIGAVILAGGQSSRMRKDKVFLTLDGKTFLDHIVEQLSGFEEILLSVDSADKYDCKNLERVTDMYPNCGPISGLYSALRSCRSDYLLVLCCDIPLFTKDLAQYMSTFVDDYHDAFVLITREKYVLPLCAIYKKQAADILETQIKNGINRPLHALEKMRVRHIPLCDSVFEDDTVRGVNTPDEYAALLQRDPNKH